MSTLTPAWNKARHHILISNFRAFISPKCHPAGLVNYWQTDTNAKGHIKEAKSSGPGRACPLLLPSTGRQTLLVLLLEPNGNSDSELPTYDSWPTATDSLQYYLFGLYERPGTITGIARLDCEWSHQIKIKSRKWRVASTAYRLLQKLRFDYCSSFLTSKKRHRAVLGSACSHLVCLMKSKLR